MQALCKSSHAITKRLFAVRSNALIRPKITIRTNAPIHPPLALRKTCKQCSQPLLSTKELCTVVRIVISNCTRRIKNNKLIIVECERLCAIMTIHKPSYQFVLEFRDALLLRQGQTSGDALLNC